MSDEELLLRLRLEDTSLTDFAADRIEALGRACTEWAEVSQSNYQRAKAAEAKLAKAVEALRNLHGAVCGETGFAAAVRAESGKAYPWPWLDQSDADARAILAEIKGESHE